MGDVKGKTAFSRYLMIKKDLEYNCLNGWCVRAELCGKEHYIVGKDGNKRMFRSMP